MKIREVALIRGPEPRMDVDSPIGEHEFYDKQKNIIIRKSNSLIAEHRDLLNIERKKF